MPSLARRLARRHLPHRVRRAGLVLLGRDRPLPAAAPKTKGAAKPTPKPKPKPKAVTPAPAARATSAAPVPLLAVLRRGGSLVEALAAETRQLVADQQQAAAVSLGTTLLRDPRTAEAGRLALGIAAGVRDHHALAWSHLDALPPAVWAPYAAREWVRAGLDQQPDETLRRVAELAQDSPAAVPAAAWLELIGPVFGRGEAELARQLFAVLDARVGDGSDVAKGLVVQRDWLRRWVYASPDGVSAPAVAEGKVSFAVLAYDHPGRARASANIGDHVQSLASLGHIVRHQGVEYDGPQDLVDLLTQLRGRVRPELQRHGASTRVQLLQVDRDASMYSAVPPDTWALAFGWYMHAIFETRYGFPFHPNLLPIFVSFHASKRDLLVDEAVEYLRRVAPIGCRDWTTVDILLSVGVPAFFSGCMTTTVRTVFPEPVERPGEDAPVGYVDMPPAAVPKGAPTHAHSSDSIRFRSFAANMGDAVDLLELYRSTYRGMVTSRLHCYLPVRSLGVPVDFQPKNRSDPRFAGLIDITDAEFTRIQTTIDSRLEQVTEAILAGTPPEEVYALWRAINADDVAAAERRRAADQPLPAPRVDLEAELARVRDGVRTTPSDAVPVVVPVGAGDAELVEVLIRSVAAHTTRRVQFFLLGRHTETLDLTALAAAVPGHEVEVVDTRGVGDDVRAAGRKPSPADLDRLLLPELLHRFDRVVVLPAAAVVTADVGELSGLELGGALLAAPDPAGQRSASGFGVLNNAANRLRDRTVPAAELRRRAYARHRFDFDAFDVDVLVLDLAGWRSHEVLAASQPYLEEFGLGYRELLHLAVGPHRAVVPDRWHQVPGRSRVVDPALLHWAAAPQPWGEDAAPEAERWFAARDGAARATAGQESW